MSCPCGTSNVPGGPWLHQGWCRLIEDLQARVAELEARVSANTDDKQRAEYEAAAWRIEDTGIKPD